MALTASEARRRLFELIEEVNEGAEAVEILFGPNSAFLVPAEEYRSLMELAHLCHSPENARRLFTSILDVKNGVVEQHDLLQDGDDSAS